MTVAVRMKLIKAPDITSTIDEPFLVEALAAFPKIENLTILRELVGGKTKASVLLVDIVSRIDQNKSSPDVLSGQFVLKIDHRSKNWPGEPVEPQRHKKAVEWDASGRFSKLHIPKLRHSYESRNMLLMLYEVAGLSQLRLSSYEHLGIGDHAACCGLLSKSILTELNAKYKIESAVSARRSLEDWLSYRLDPIQGKTLFDFAANHTLCKSAFAAAGQVYLNPIWVCNSKEVADDMSGTRFLGLQHSDLHVGNVFFDRLSPQGNPFWIIDWALSRECPLFFDQAYFEMSLLIRELSGKPQERLILLLEAADGDVGSTQATIPQEHMALAASMQELRRSVNSWQIEFEPNRRDPFVHQWLLARIAAGLNWANKPLDETGRLTAFMYAAKAATDFMKLFHMPAYTTAIRAADTAVVSASGTAPASIESISHDEWSAFWRKLEGFDESVCTYILISGKLKDQRDSSTLGFLPWSAIFDLDAESEEHGLYKCAAEVLRKRRSLSWFGKNILPVNFQRGTAWMMVNGWPSRREDIPQSLEMWRRDYLRKVRELSALVRAGTAPKPVKILVIPGVGIKDEMLGRLVEAIDEELGDSGEFSLIASPAHVIAGIPLIKPGLSISAPAFLNKLHAVYGSEETASTPTLPSISGLVEIPPESLRNWEEDLDILHSLILETSSGDNVGTSHFLRGMPPTWQDLAANLDVSRDITAPLQKAVEERLQEGRNATVELWHSPGAGGTTVACRLAWSLRKKYPTLVLRRYSRLTADRIDAVFQKSQKSVLLVADESDLPSTAREELFRDLGRRNSRICLLYLVRSPHSDPAASLSIFDPIDSPDEIKRFLEAYLPRCKNDSRRRRLQQIANLNNAGLRGYRSPFFFGLTTFEEDFLTLDRYVGTHLKAITPLPRQAILYLALTTRFSQKGLSEAFFRKLFQPPISQELVLEEALGRGPARLVVHGNSRLKIVHPLVAEEILRELLGGPKPDAWQSALKDLCVQLIRDVVSIVGPYSDEGKELFTQLFIFRAQWTDLAKAGKRQFSPLIEALPSIDGQQQVLALLTEVCPIEPHYWNHLGRHLIYKTNQNFETAERYLLKAVELSGEKDHLHFHALGMVRRFWARHILSELFKNSGRVPNLLNPKSILSGVGAIVEGALDAFSKARKLDPDDEHNYITPIQTIVMVAERMCQAGGEASIADLCARQDEIGRWVQERVSEAEEMLERVQHFRGAKRQSEHEQRCEFSLTALYGDFDQLIDTWEKVLNRSESHSWLRKAIAHAYVARNGRKWSTLGSDELRAITDLSECNLSFDPTSESDLRTWFHAYRFLPEFSFSEAIDRLQAWATRSESVDAHYYLYVLHFLRWKSGGERDEDLIQKHLKRSAELAVGRRDNSYEWFGSEPHWCPVVNSRELGGWSEQKNFFADSSKLAYVEGTILSLKRTAGLIRIGDVTRAFFRPPSHLRESEHINAKVHFWLGFSYERLHAWSVDLGPAPALTNRSKVGPVS